MIAARLTTIELLAELQSRDVQPSLMAAICKREMRKAADRIKQRGKDNPRKIRTCTMHPAWAQPRRWPSK